jgi:membrane protein
LSWDLSEIPKRIQHAIWTPPLDGMPRWKAFAYRLARIVLALVRDVESGDLTLRAMSLVYTTLLSLVPLLALSFSVLKAFGVHNQIEPMLNRFLAPLGDKRDEVTHRVIGFIENLNVGVLGAVGLVLLLYTVVALVQKIETSFNHIWHVHQPRSLGERFSNYLSVLMIGPILVFSALAVTAGIATNGLWQHLMAVQPVGELAYWIGRATPFLLVIAAFTFIYVFVPNTKVRFLPALVGGIVGGVLWELAGMLFTLFVTTSTRYSAIYSSFAILILFMIWLYLSWLILLIGASVAFYRQHPEYLVARSGEPALSMRMRERLALTLMGMIARQHLYGGPPWTLERFTQQLGVTMHSADLVLDALCDSGLLAVSGEEDPGYLPARDLEAVSIKQLLDAVRRAGEDPALTPNSLPVPVPVEMVLQKLEEATASAVEAVTLRDLAGPPLDGAAEPGLLRKPQHRAPENTEDTEKS